MVVLTGHIPGLLLCSISFLIGFFVLTISQIIRKENVFSYWKQPITNYLFVTAGVGLYTTLIYVSFKIIPPIEANTLNYLWPIFLVLLAEIFHKKSLNLNKILGIFLGFLGVLLMFMPRGSESFFTNISLGHVMALSASIIWAVYSTLARKKHYPMGIMAPMYLFSSIVCLVLHMFFEKTVWPEGTIEWFAVILVGIARISYTFWDYGMKEGNVTFLASASYFIPVFSTIFLIAIGIKPEDTLVGWSVALVLLGCLLVNANQIYWLYKNKSS